MNQSNLIIHCGAAVVERDAVAQVVTPERTDTWTPISHLEFLNQVEANLGGQNLRVVNQAHALTKNGDRYFGLLQVDNRPADIVSEEWYGKQDSAHIKFEQQSEYGYIVGLRNSHDKSYPASLVVGSQVFVCDNLSFSGEIKVSRKHTTYISRDLPALTAKAIGLLAEKWTDQENRFTAYKQHELSNVDAHDLLIRALDIKAVTAQQIPHVLREWRTPRHPEFAACGPTAWRLFNAVTEVAKDTGSLWGLPRRTTALHGLLDQACGLLGFRDRFAAAQEEIGADADIQLN